MHTLPGKFLEALKAIYNTVDSIYSFLVIAKNQINKNKIRMTPRINQVRAILMLLYIYVQLHSNLEVVECVFSLLQS